MREEVRQDQAAQRVPIKMNSKRPTPRHVIIYLFIFRERGREGERGEVKQCVVASCTPSTEDLACNPGMCPDWELNQ